MLVFPRVTKAGAGVGGEFGKGALLVHGRTVGYYKVTGGSIGATLGVAYHSEVILFMTDEARDHFMHSSDWSIGADAGVAIVKKRRGGAVRHRDPAQTGAGVRLRREGPDGRRIARGRKGQQAPRSAGAGTVTV